MTYLPYGAIEAFDCERVAIVLPSSAYKEGQYPESIVVHHSAGLNATPVKFGIEYVPKEVRERLAAENAKLWALCRDMYLVVELLDMDGMALQAHGKSSDWRTLKERYDELTGVDG